ncbi:TSUP family transporter [Flavobacterium sp. GT3R68]|uniref:sulfite exporter TauE/SafE family protein n=1 Tax=Flavobacterium sp. GT3R68 TaxID=2594437 RepID=UPI000F8979FD|nr:TSUP family transporter [Flavobacterium sp. GT3R68]RTY94974.1 sulfite exporter TauE/SafE family protein [Flavobacterium sp. GSN2]TRW91779.1 TSUP family transporter [Flavobacterium sp. GT3R68]
METSFMILLCIAAFAAGFVDAIVGGGGLIQTPMGLILLPNLPVATIIGTLKIPSFSGTFFAAFQYLKKVEMNWKLLAIMMTLAAPSAFAGSTLLTYVSNDFMKPLLLVVLSLLVIYTYAKKNFGQHADKSHSSRQQILYAVLISFFIGFYDGFIGPGTGSFLVLAFITLLGFDFLQASANAKMVNLATNFGSICLFIIKGKIIWMIAIPMAVCNAIGGFIGAKLAINRGNKFIRIFFLLVVIATLIRFGYDVFVGK